MRRAVAVLVTAGPAGLVPSAAFAVSSSPTPLFSVSPGNLSLTADSGTTATATVTATSNGDADELRAAQLRAAGVRNM
jgi:hypothetical protein